MTMSIQTPESSPSVAASRGDLIYRFEGSLGELYPVGIFTEGIRFHNDFNGRIVDGPFAGARIFGLDQFLLRPDGVGEIDAPEIIDAGDRRIALHVRGYVVPPAGMTMPPLEVVASPDFAFPDVDFRVTASATIKTVAPGCERLNHTVAIIEGTVNMATGRLAIEARAA
jgi:hypothetical protein